MYDEKAVLSPCWSILMVMMKGTCIDAGTIKGANEKQARGGDG